MLIKLGTLLTDVAVSFLPGYREYEYALVIHPHEDLRNRVMDIRKEFNEKYKVIHPAMAKPAITLATFTQHRMMEERIVNRLEIIAMGFHPLKIELKDYGSFPSHSIFINVTSRLPVQELVKQIRHEAQRLMKMDNEHKPHFIMDPYMIIARKLQPWQYERGIAEYSHRSFTARFIAHGMLLLRRPVGELRYSPVQQFEFRNLPVSVKQGDLF